MSSDSNGAARLGPPAWRYADRRSTAELVRDASHERRTKGALLVGVQDPGTWERLVKKGRHRRFEEARSLKRAFEVRAEPCPECGARPEDDHASWCLHDSEELEDEEEENPTF